MREINYESSNSEHHNNLDLIYQYTESILKAANEEERAINTKLGTVIAFNGIIIRIAMDLPDRWQEIAGMPCYSCLLIKIAVFALIISSIWVGVSGFKTHLSPYGVVRPGELLDNWYRADSEECKILIVKGLRQAVEGLSRQIDEKSEKLNLALTLLAIAATLYALGALIPSLSSSAIWRSP